MENAFKNGFAFKNIHFYNFYNNYSHIFKYKPISGSYMQILI